MKARVLFALLLVPFALHAQGDTVATQHVAPGITYRHIVEPKGPFEIHVLHVSFNPSGRSEGTALYTPRFGPSAPRDSARKTVEAALTTAGRRGDTLLFVRLGPVSQTSGSAIPVDGAVLAAYGAGSRMQEVLAMQPGDTVRVLLGTLPKLSSGAPVTLIGGLGPPPRGRAGGCLR